jgi:DNA-binding MarR family transcriptional regulator
MHANDEIQERQIKDAPFCWQHKGALEMIRDYFEDGNGHSASALSTYLALTELASDAQSETFTASIRQIAARGGVSYRTTAAILNRLEKLKLLHVERSTVPGTKGNAPSTYTLLTPLGNHCLTLGKQNQNCLPRLKKNQKNLNKPPNPPQGGGFRLRRFRNGAKPPRLASMRNNQLQSLRSKIIAERNSGKLSREEKDTTREQLVEIKRILKTRGIEYAASL